MNACKHICKYVRDLTMEIVASRNYLPIEGFCLRVI